MIMTIGYGFTCPSTPAHYTPCFCATFSSCFLLLHLDRVDEPGLQVLDHITSMQALFVLLLVVFLGNLHLRSILGCVFFVRVREVVSLARMS